MKWEILPPLLCDYETRDALLGYIAEKKKRITSFLHRFYAKCVEDLTADYHFVNRSDGFSSSIFARSSSFLFFFVF